MCYYTTISLILLLYGVITNKRLKLLFQALASSAFSIISSGKDPLLWALLLELLRTVIFGLGSHQARRLCVVRKPDVRALF